MIFAILTLLTALALAAVAGWFSIIGIMAIYAGVPVHAFVMGVVLECGKLVTTSWVYRNWKYATWSLRIPLIVFVFALMIVTSIGVFGFLSKAHLEQGASTVDNAAKVERIDQQIAREQVIIDRAGKSVAQLDATLDSYIGKDRADRSVVIRKRQATERKQLKEDIDAAQTRLDQLSEEKLKLTSEVRAVQLEVGPIRYIAELLYGVGDDPTKNIELAVRMYTLLIVLILDPLAVTLLVAANNSLLRRQYEKEKIKQEDNTPTSGDNSQKEPSIDTENNTSTKHSHQEEGIVYKAPGTTSVDIVDDKILSNIQGQQEFVSQEVPDSPVFPPLSSTPLGLLDEETNIEKKNPSYDDREIQIMHENTDIDNNIPLSEDIVTPTMVQSKEIPKIQEITKESYTNPDNSIWREIVGTKKHFIPKKVEEIQNKDIKTKKIHKYPKAFGWLNEFRGTKYE